MHQAKVILVPELVLLTQLVNLQFFMLNMVCSDNNLHFLIYMIAGQTWMDLESMDGQGQNFGNLKMEQTTQYEFGFKQQIGNVAALDITAFYKNVKGLINEAYLNYTFGQTEKGVIGRINADFGTVKGLAFAFNLRRIGPLSAKIDYTLEQAEGTGSSQNSAFVAAFRSPGNKTPVGHSTT